LIAGEIVFDENYAEYFAVILQQMILLAKIQNA